LTIYFLKDIISSKKKRKLRCLILICVIDVKQATVRYLFVPQYEGLGLKEIYSHIDADL
jgi:hypothetical protein